MISKTKVLANTDKKSNMKVRSEELKQRTYRKTIKS